ncbi:hypothetical protein LSUE1_G002550 [Lachnellula suecica]|uniref:MYND-type domain-containing protein n=1 Tax=Lachnellula suecica TaxID=602035 RepID=A0A8T9C4X0_9HELO|nr:hypothetical protein LSUE1_G002550 [Lachnellula suecica]
MADQRMANPVEAEGSRSGEARENVESTNEAQQEIDAGSSTAQQKCTSCNKPEMNPDTPLKPCIKCHSSFYCDRDCQKADFKQHKKVCAKQAQIYAQGANFKLATPRSAPKDGHRGGLQKWQFDT